MVQEDGQLEKTVVRGSELELPAEAIISHGSIFEDYEEVAAKSRRLEGGSNRQISLQAPIVLPDSTASKLAESKLRDDWVSRETCTVTLTIKMLTITLGDIIEFAENKGQQWQVSNVERNLAQTVSLTSTIYFPKLSTSNNLKTYANIVPSFMESQVRSYWICRC